MCGRATVRDKNGVDLGPSFTKKTNPYTLTDPVQPALWQPRYNLAPTDPIPTIRVVDGRIERDAMRWGLIPEWWTQPKPPGNTFNARDDNLFSNTMWRRVVNRQRCLISIDGFYE